MKKIVDSSFTPHVEVSSNPLGSGAPNVKTTAVSTSNKDSGDMWLIIGVVILIIVIIGIGIYMYSKKKKNGIQPNA